ncbi:NDP-sugar pyrophosphorylase family protein [Streptacidiphilus sp. MAP12-20]|uniref:sugar phosphate nucleotidyltransferase n=1 Tax=Streptacidiphilus sp. MAP12-20 TaxID=3156299 RepID=UPI00351388F9
MEAVSAIALAGGQGIRARPITLNSDDYLRSKAAVSVAGRPLIEWMVTSLGRLGVRQFYVVANGRENRAQTKSVLGHGERFGAAVRYSRARFDQGNTGSGEATLRCLDYWDLSGLALVVPTDSVFDFDLEPLVRAHLDAGAVVTVASVLRPAETAAGTYGVLEAGPDGVLRRFVEKPSWAQARAMGRAHPDGLLHTNTGMYLVDCRRLRMAATDPALAAMARIRLDWGGDLLPYLVAAGHRVLTRPIRRFGDLGSPPAYLDTLKDVLLDRYPLLSAGIDPLLWRSDSVRIHESSLEMKDPVSGRTLADKISDGSVRIGPGVRIGRDVEIGPGVTLAESDIGDGADIGQNCVLRGVACGDHTVIGPGARLSDVFLGCMVDVRSTLDRPVHLSDYCALGDEVQVPPGARLRGVHASPKVRITEAGRYPAGVSLSGVRDLLRWV